MMYWLKWPLRKKKNLLDVKNDLGETPRQIAPTHIWEAVVEDFDANWCNPAVELVSQHLINDVAGMVVAYGKLALWKNSNGYRKQVFFFFFLRILIHNINE